MTDGPRFLDEDQPAIIPSSAAPIPQAAFASTKLQSVETPRLLEEEPDAPARLSDIQVPAKLNAPYERVGTSLLMACGVGGLVVIWVLFSVVTFLLAQFRASSVLGVGAGFCIAASLGLMGMAVVIEIRAWRALSELGRLRGVLSANLVERDVIVVAALEWVALVGSNLPDTPEIESAIRSAISAGEVRALLRTRVADPLEVKARNLGQRGAAECAAILAVCPHEAWDGLIVGARGLRLIRQIGALYGVRPGLAVTVSMARSVAWTAATTTGMAVLAESVANWAVTDAPFIKHLAGAAGASAAESVRILRLARVAAKACCPLDAR